MQVRNTVEATLSQRMQLCEAASAAAQLTGCEPAARLQATQVLKSPLSDRSCSANKGRELAVNRCCRSGVVVDVCGQPDGFRPAPQTLRLASVRSPSVSDILAATAARRPQLSTRLVYLDRGCGHRGTTDSRRSRQSAPTKRSQGPSCLHPSNEAANAQFAPGDLQDSQVQSEPPSTSGRLR